MKRKKLSSLGLIAILILASCATPPKKTNAKLRTLSLQGKAMVTGIEQKTQFLGLEISVQEPAKLRIEVFNSSLGVYLGRLIFNGSGYLLVHSREKQYFAGDNAAEAVRKWFFVALDTKDLAALLLDGKFQSSEWLCEGQGKVRCSWKADPATYIETNFAGGQREFKIQANEGRLEMKLSSDTLQLDSTKDGFSLNPPNGFTKTSL